MEEEKKIIKEYGQIEPSIDSNFEKIKNAVESKKILNELKYSGFTRALTAITAVGTVVVLIWQVIVAKENSKSALEESKNARKAEYIEYLDRTVEKEWEKKNTYQAKNEGLEQKYSRLSDLIGGLSAEKNKLEIQISTLHTTQKEFEDNIAVLKTKLVNQSVEVKKAKSKEIRHEIEKIEKIYRALISGKNSEIQKLKQHLKALEIVIKIKEDESKSLLSKQDFFEKYEVVETGKLVPRGTSLQLGEYKITFTNIGNRQKNIDLHITNNNRTKHDLFENLILGKSYSLQFDGKLFFVDVQGSVQAEKKENEGGQFRIGFLNKPYIRYR
ncbi:MAG: hypothetical protein GY737_19430 [Desulfobacteraceae bacterium]|nr:hypothetical protein [Desulfobacteraceae bacterium]